MASCEKIKLSIENGDALFSKLYVLKMYLSEGISMPPLARLTVIANAQVPPSKLKQLLGKNVRITLIQSTMDSAVVKGPIDSDRDVGGGCGVGSSAGNAVASEANLKTHESLRYVHGRISNITFLQKVSRSKIAQANESAANSENCSYVYEVSVASALEQLQSHVSCELLQGSKPTEVLETLLTNYYASDQSFSYDLNALKNADNSAKTASASAFAATVGMYSQDNEEAYALFQRLLCLAQANYCFVHKAEDFGEQLYVAAGLDFPHDSDNSIAQLYDSEGKALAISDEFDLDQKSSELSDFTYTCTKNPCPAFDFLNNADDQKASLSIKDQHLLRADPFLQWLCPVQLDRNSKNSVYVVLAQRLAQIKRNQLLLQGEEISAHAYNLAFQPNMRFTLKGVGEDLHLLVLRSELLAVAPFPDSRAYPAPTHAAKCLQLKLTLLNTDSFTSGYGCLLEPQQLMSPELMFAFPALELFAQTHVSSVGAMAAGDFGSMGSVGGIGGERGVSSVQQREELNFEHAIGGLNKLQSVVASKRYSENQSQLFTATVCTNTGVAQDRDNIDWTGRIFVVEHDNLSEPLQVYASLDDTQKLVVVDLLNGFEVGGIVPRVGSKIKVLMSRGQYLCLGQIAIARNVFDEEQRQRNLYSRRWCNKKDQKELQINQSLLTCGSKTINKLSREGVSGEEEEDAESAIGLEYFDNAFDEVVFHLEHDSLKHLAFNQAVTLNDAALLHQYEQKVTALKKAYSDMLAKQDTYEAAHQAYFAALADVSTERAELDSLKEQRESESDAYVEAYNSFYEKVSTMVTVLKLPNKSGKMQSNLFSRQGDVLLNSANGYISLLAQGVNEAAESINLSGKTIKISADNKLVLAVGGNTISLDRNGVVIESRKWTGMPGMFDSQLLLDSMSGVSITGLSTNVSGVLGTSLSDGFGGNVGLANGSCNISGMNCSIGASVDQKSLSNLIRFFINGANEITNMGLTLGKVDNADVYNSLQKGAYFATNDINNMWFGIMKGIVDFNKVAAMSKTNKARPLAIITCINDCLSIIVTTITITEHIMMSFLGSTLNQTLSDSVPNYTVRDLIRTLAASLKVFMTLSTVIAMMTVQGLKKKVASISFSPEELKFDAKNINGVSVESVFTNNPVAGDVAVTSTLSGSSQGNVVQQPSNS